MKTVTFIFAAIVLFLSTQCMVIEFGSPVGCAKKVKPTCSKKKTCDRTGKSKSTKKCRTVCNPFMACSGCVYETAVNEVVAVSTFPSKIVRNGFPNKFFISSYISSAWKPPEFI